jgi:hypothetical protein
MPVPAATNDCYQVRIIGSVEGQETENVLHFKLASTDDDVLTHLVIVLVTCFVTNLLPVITSAWSLVEVRWKQVTPVLGPEFIYIPPAAGPGGGPATALPSFNSALFTVRTALGGKSHRGRMYLPGIPEAASINSELDPANAFWDGLVAFAACVAANFIAGDPPGAHSWMLCVYSRKIGGSSFPYGATGFTPMTTFTPVKLIASTRSRKVGRGS